MISFESKITQKLFTFFFVNQEKEVYMNELARILNVDPGNLDRKLKELEKEGIFKSEFRGKQKYYFLNRDFPLLHEYKQIFNKTIGLEHQLKKPLSKIKEISHAYIYGSYAKDKLDTHSDIDLMIIVKLDTENILGVLSESLDRIEKATQREINYILYSEKEFKEKLKSKNPFLEEVFSDKYIALIP